MSRITASLLVVALVLAACGGTPGPGAPSAGAATAGASGSPPAGGAVSCAPDGSEATPDPGWAGPDASPDTTTELVPLLVSSELAVGANRFLFTLIDGQNRLVASPDVDVDIRFFDLAASGEEPVAEVTAAYLQAEEDRGLYRAAVDFTCAGTWGAELTARIPGREQRRTRVVFPVRPESSTPAIGAAVPASDTPTAESPEDIALISTDEDPDPDFYRLSAADALEAGEPFALVFATPLFCQTRACGPTLDIVREVAADFEGRMAFLHVEPYQLEPTDSGLQPVLSEQGRFQSVPSVVEWGLPSEPYIFVVDDAGTLAAKFEGVAGADELRAAFEQVAAN